MHEADRYRVEAGLSVDQACHLVGRARRTWTYWRQHGFPAWVVRFLRLRAGYLDELGWEGWQIRAGVLYTNELGRYSWTPEQLFAEWWHRQLVSYYQRHDRETRSEQASGSAERASLPPPASVQLLPRRAEGARETPTERTEPQPDPLGRLGGSRRP